MVKGSWINRMDGRSSSRRWRWWALRAIVGVAVILSMLVADLFAGGSGKAVGFTSLAVQRQIGGGGYTPDQIATAYNVAPLLSQGIDGTGETIALVEFDQFSPRDIADFDRANNLPDPTIQQFYVGGSSFPLTRSAETTMDLEWAHALAPGATIQIYYLRNQQANVAGWQSLADAVDAAVSRGAATISLSFGACRPTNGYTATRSAFARALAQGVSVFVSSGDSGALPGPVKECGHALGVAYPASDPSIVAVGGTSLDLGGDGSIFQEVAWQLSGGGKGKPLPRPAWQVAPTLGAGHYRYSPDVSFLADPRTGAIVVYHSSLRQAGGTSLGAPAWAAIWALVVQDASTGGRSLPAAPIVLYGIGNSSQYSQAFNDITSGSNGRYHAGPGWDPVTGWGTPNVAGLAATATALAPSLGGS